MIRKNIIYILVSILLSNFYTYASQSNDELIVGEIVCKIRDYYNTSRWNNLKHYQANDNIIDRLTLDHYCDIVDLIEADKASFVESIQCNQDEHYTIGDAKEDFYKLGYYLFLKFIDEKFVIENPKLRITFIKKCFILLEEKNISIRRSNIEFQNANLAFFKRNTDLTNTMQSYQTQRNILMLLTLCLVGYIAKSHFF